MQCFWTYCLILFFSTLCVSYFFIFREQKKVIDEFLKLETDELWVKETTDTTTAWPVPSQLSSFQLKNSSKKLKRNCKCLRRQGMRRPSFHWINFLLRIWRKNGNEIFGRKASSFQISWEIGRNGAWTSCLEMPLLWGIRENFKGQIGAVMDDLWLRLFSREEERMFLFSGSWKNLIKEGKEW